ncbi:MAG: histidine phosphatase family protein [Planctomycetes bacterium]|nr:histidine phosphatase family protein [Planctomycetota bacterium]
MRGSTLVLAAVLALAGCDRPPDAGPPPGGVVVHLVRHAEAWKNVAAPPPDADPDALTPAGAAQAEALARWVVAQGGADVVVCSDTGRTRATAAAIARACGVEVVVSDAFAMLRGDVGWDARTAAWAAGEDLRPPGGEALEDGCARALAALEALARGRGRVVVVTHGDIVAGLLGACAGTPPPERWARHEVPAGSVSEARLEAGRLVGVSQGVVPGR